MGMDARTLAPHEVALAVEWAAREGWNPGLDDAAAFLAQDSGGFLGVFDREQQLAACVSAVRYGADFGFLGFYICRPDLRGRGLGLKVWDAAMARLAGRVVGLDGVLAQQENYRKSGFVLAHRNIRYGGPPQAFEADGAVFPLGTAALDEAGAMDDACFGVPRPDFRAKWLAPAHGRAFGIHRAGALAGYGVVRRCRSGHKIGPLFADTPADAHLLFRALSTFAHAHAPEAPLFLDVPEPNGAARALAEGAGFAPVFETARMYKGPAPGLPLDRIFGITSFELG
ncbi:GNAT family N-acetyltransferase [Xanthobacter sp. VNH20]|uniref:GNAT family N-acetyltransferase n=1 Tax=Xanthobacter sp. VNH20 TaxID=3156616 RepID=UPI0032B3444C